MALLSLPVDQSSGCVAPLCSLSFFFVAVTRSSRFLSSLRSTLLLACSGPKARGFLLFRVSFSILFSTRRNHSRGTNMSTNILVRICGPKILRTVIREQKSWITVSRCLRSVELEALMRILLIKFEMLTREFLRNTCYSRGSPSILDRR